MAKAKTTTKTSKTKATSTKTTPKSIATAHETHHDSRTPKTSLLGGDLQLGALFAELVGTFILTTVALNVGGNAIIVAVTVIILVMVLGRLSGAHVNPAATLGLLATRQISVVRAVGYLIAQLLGAMLAVVIVTQFVHTGGADPTTGQSQQLFQVAKLTGDWRPFFGEMLGGLIFGFGVAATFLGKKQGVEAGFTVGGALLLGLIVATQASAAVVNPAVALGVSAYQLSNGWSILTYAIAPVLGAIAAMWLYKAFLWDVENNK